MISTLVVTITMLMAGCFTLVYLLRPAWRNRIEQPKHYFHEQLQRYDNQTRNSRSHDEAAS